ncbi:MAG: MFS transporter [Deltaproteobacteria bacterium]|nr:MFS transporter [Deltaproteobacteria bacterium]
MDKGGEDILYSFALSGSMLLVAISMPLLGAFSDRMGRRIPLLIGLTLLSVFFAGSIGIFDHLILGLIFFALANFGYHAALVPYDALLPRVSRGYAVGRIAGIGVALGYVGAILGIMMVKPFVSESGRAASFIPTAALFLVFSLPCFFMVKEGKGKAAVISWRAVREEALKIKNTLVSTAKYPGLLRFLIANFIFCDAVNTVIAFMSVYAHQVVGFSDDKIRILLIVSTTFAVAGSLLFGWVTDRLGAKRTLMVVLGIWIIGLVVAMVSFAPALFWMVGPIVGIALGGTWVSARVLVIDLSPPEKIGEIYGLYNMGGKFGFILGPLVWGAIVWAFSGLGILRYRIAIFSMLLFIVGGLYLLRKVPVART